MTGFNVPPAVSQIVADATAPMASADYSGLSTGGAILSTFGAITSAIGGFYAAEAQKNQLKSQALSAEFEQSMSEINARAAESTAQQILAAGQQETGLRSLEYGQAAGAQRAQTAAAGIQGGVGSSAEVAASIQLAKMMDALTIRGNTVRAAEGARSRGVDQRNRGAIAGVSAQNLRSGAGSVRPWMSGTSSLLGDAGRVAEEWVYRGESRRRY